MLCTQPHRPEQDRRREPFVQLAIGQLITAPTPCPSWWGRSQAGRLHVAVAGMFDLP